MRFSASLALVLLISTASGLDVGATAPALTGVAWTKGAAPVFSSQYTIVEFWATWCPPCRTSIPHLSQLNTRYGDRLAVVGLSNEDAATVRAFVDQQGEAMNFNVGTADPRSAVFQHYMGGVDGIPYAYLVDPTGVVVWAGDPMAIDAELATRLGQ